jgi:hypothetical protein
MTTYPAIIPSSRPQFLPAEYLHTAYRAMSGKQSRVRHSSSATDSIVELSYSAVNEAEMLQILNHYRSVNGTFQSFPVPDIVWSGNENAEEFTLPGSTWKYVEKPSVEEVFCGNNNSGTAYLIAVKLRSTFGEGIVVVGPQFRARVVFTPGEVITPIGPRFRVRTRLFFGMAYAPGFIATAQATFTPGVVTTGKGVTMDPIMFAARASFRRGMVITNNEKLFIVKTFFMTGVSVPSPTYSQSSVYADTLPADSNIMMDGSFANTGAATLASTPKPWIKMDLGSLQFVYQVVIGTATDAIPGGWNKSFTENRIVQFSTDDNSWTTAFNTGTFASNGIYTFDTMFKARYIRITLPVDSIENYVALSEFYARVLGGPIKASGGVVVPGSSFTVAPVFTPGAVTVG